MVRMARIVSAAVRAVGEAVARSTSELLPVNDGDDRRAAAAAAVAFCSRSCCTCVCNNWLCSRSS